VPSKTLDAVFFVKEPPIVSFADGLFYVTFAVGSASRFELVMAPNTFLRMRRAGGDAAAAFHAGSHKVVALPRH
jgi:hypothetical protein